MDKVISEQTKTNYGATHQSLKTAQLRFLEIVEFPIESLSLANGSIPLVARVLKQR